MKVRGQVNFVKQFKEGVRQHSRTFLAEDVSDVLPEIAEELNAGQIAGATYQKAFLVLEIGNGQTENPGGGDPNQKLN